MIQWIYNQKCKNKKIELVRIFCYAVGLSLVWTGLHMMYQVHSFSTSSWYTEDVHEQMAFDIFFSEKSDMIHKTIIVLFFAVIVYVLATLCIIRKIQLKGYAWKVASYRACGYSRRQVYQALHMDSFVDILCAVPFGGIIFVGIEMALMRQEMLVQMFAMTHTGSIERMMQIISGFLCILAVIFIRENCWFYQEKKRGIAGMLKGN